MCPAGLSGAKQGRVYAAAALGLTAFVLLRRVEGGDPGWWFEPAGLEYARLLVIASAGRQLLERVRASGDLIDRPASDASGCRDTRPLSLLLAGGVRDCRSRSSRGVEPPRLLLGEPGCPAPTGRKVYRYSSGATWWCARTSPAPVAVNTARVVGSRVVTGAGWIPWSRLTDRRRRRAPTQRWLAMLSDLRGDVAGQWRSGRGNAADQRGRLTGRGGTHARSRAVPGMSASVDVAHGGGIARTADGCRRCRRRSVSARTESSPDALKAGRLPRLGTAQ